MTTVPLPSNVAAKIYNKISYFCELTKNKFLTVLNVTFPQPPKTFAELMGGPGRPVWPLWELLKWMVGKSAHTMAAIGKLGNIYYGSVPNNISFPLYKVHMVTCSVCAVGANFYVIALYLEL